MSVLTRPHLCMLHRHAGWTASPQRLVTSEPFPALPAASHCTDAELRQRVAAVGPAAWAAVAELYNRLGDADELRVVRASHLSGCPGELVSVWGMCTFEGPLATSTPVAALAIMRTGGTGGSLRLYRLAAALMSKKVCNALIRGWHCLINSPPDRRVALSD